MSWQEIGVWEDGEDSLSLKRKKIASQSVFFGKILNNTAVYTKILHTILIGL